MGVHRTICMTLILLVALVGGSGCKEEKQEPAGSYEGVGKLVAQRNQARYRTSSNKNRSTDDESTEEKQAEAPRNKPSELLVEEEVRVVSAASGKTIARGTIYFDKNGNIINIRVKQN